MEDVKKKTSPISAWKLTLIPSFFRRSLVTTLTELTRYTYLESPEWGSRIHQLERFWTKSIRELMDRLSASLRETEENNEYASVAITSVPHEI
jgi:hypothetical protein